VTPVPPNATAVAPRRSVPPIEAKTTAPRTPVAGVMEAMCGGWLTVRVAGAETRNWPGFSGSGFATVMFN